MKHKLFLLTILALCIVLFSSCTLEKPEVPVFSTSLTIPVGQDSVTVMELLDDDEAISIGENSVLDFSVDGDSTIIELDFDYGVEIEETTFESEIGPISINNIPIIDYIFEPYELSEELAELPPGFEDIPPFTFDVNGDPANLEGIEEVLVSGGELYLTLTNNLPVPISGNEQPETIIITLINGNDGVDFASFIFDSTLLPGSAETKTISISGSLLPSSMGIVMTGGSTGGTVPGGLTPEHDLKIELEISDLEATEAISEISEQNFIDSGNISLPDSLGIISAELEQGDLSISFENQLPVSCNLQLNFHELYLNNGENLSIEIDIPANDVTTSFTALSGATIESGDGSPLSELSYDIIFTTSDSNGQTIQISSDDYLSINFESSSLSLYSVTGILPSETWELDPVTEELDLPSEIEGISLLATTCVIDIQNDTGVAGEINLIITGYTNNGPTVTLSHNSVINAQSNGSDGHTRIILDQNNSNINELINGQPDTVEFSGNISVGGNEEIGTVTVGDRASVVWGISSPISFSMESLNIEGDAELLDISNETSNKLREHLIKAELETVVINNFPFGFEINILLGYYPDSIFEQPQSIIGPITINPAEVNPENGWAVSPTTSTESILLDNNLIHLLTNDGIHTAFLVVFPSTNGNPITIRATDMATFSGILKAEVLINEEILE